MTRILVVGEGRASQSFVKELRGKDVKEEDLDGNAYYVEFEHSSPIQEGFISISHNDFQKNQLPLVGFNKVYLFPDELTNGMEMVAFFHQVGVSRIFVITHNLGFSRLYKKLGADYVIVSNGENGSYRWLFYNAVG